MEEINDIQKIIAEINRITSATRVLHPEQAILRCITFFDVALRKTKRKSLNIEIINNSLRSLVKVCDGKLSTQCSISISRHICDFYKIQKHPPFEETVTEFLGHMTPASTVVIGDLCAEFGQRKIEIVLQSISALKKQIVRYENLYSLHRIFKSYQNYNNAISKYAYQVYNLVIKNFNSLHVSCHIISFKLLRALVKNDLYLCPLSVSFAESILKRNNISQFVKNEAIKLAATVALCSTYEEGFKILLKFKQISNSNQNSSNSNSNASNSNSFSSVSLSNLALFSSKSVVTKFFERLSPDQIISDHQNLFNFVRNSSPSSIFEIASFLSKKDREKYFSAVLTERNPTVSQISILKALQVDNYTTASLAYHLTNSKVQLEQEYAISFFRTIDRETQLLYLKNSLQHLLSEKSQYQISIGDYILARCLIECVGNDEQCIKECLKSLIERKMYQNPMFWYLMSIYDKSSDLKPLIKGSSSTRIRAISSSKSLKESKSPIDFQFNVKSEMIESALEAALSNSGSLLVESLLLYFSKHPNEQWNQQIPVLMKYVSSNLEMLNNRCILALIDLCIAIRKKEKESESSNDIQTKRLDDGACNILVPFFVQRFMKNPPSSHFYSSLVSKPMLLFGDQLKLIPRSSSSASSMHSKSSKSKSASSALSTTAVIPEHQQVSRKIVLVFADLYDTLTNDSVKQSTVKGLISNLSVESHALLLQLVKSKKIKMNYESLLTLLVGNDFLRIELTCEIISFMSPPIDKIYNFVKSFPSSSPIPFLLMSSIFSNSSLENAEVPLPSSDSYLNRFISLFDSSVLSTNLFALHCLSSLLISKSVEIIALEIGANFLTTILSLVNCNVSLQPLFLILICEVFVNILPLLSVNLIGNKEMCALVLSIVESVRSCTYESAKEMYYQISSACLAYAPQFAFSYFNFIFKFPSRSSRKVKMASLDAISQSLNLTSNSKNCDDVDYALNVNLVASYESYVNGLKDIFVFLQQTNDDRIKDCINLICNYKLPPLPSSSSLSSEYGRNFDFSLFDLQFISIAKSVFIRNSLPGFADVEPMTKVKEAALYCVEQIKNVRDKFVCISKSLEMGINTTFSLLTRILSSEQKEKVDTSSIQSIWQFKKELLNIAKFAFSINLSYSNQFLNSLINDETVKDFFFIFSENCCTQRSAYFFELATKCCLIASKKEIDKDSSLKFAQLISPLLHEIIENIMNHQSTSINDQSNPILSSSLKQLNGFVFSFYSYLYSSFVWSEQIIEKISIPNEILFSFLTIEMLTIDEFWRIQGDINGLTSIVKYFDDETEGINELIDEGLQSILRLSRKQQILLNHEIYEFVLTIIRSHNKNANCKLNFETFHKIAFLSQFIEFDCEIISTVLNELSKRQTDDDVDDDDNDDECKKFLSCCRLKENESDERKLALFRISIGNSGSILSFPSQLISDFSSMENKSEKCEFYRFCVKNNFNFAINGQSANEVEFLKESMVHFVNENINNKNGRSIVNEAVQNKCDSALPKLINILLHNFKDEEDALLLAVFVEKYGMCQKIAESVTKFALNKIIEAQKGEIRKEMIVIRSILKVNKIAALKEWKGIGEENQKKIFGIVESQLIE